MSKFQSSPAMELVSTSHMCKQEPTHMGTVNMEVMLLCQIQKELINRMRGRDEFDSCPTLNPTGWPVLVLRTQAGEGAGPHPDKG